MHIVRFFGVMNFSGYHYGPHANFLVEKIPNIGNDMANFQVPPERFNEFIGMLNHIRVWRYPNPDPQYDSCQHRLMIAVKYQDGRIFGLGAEHRHLYTNYLEAMLTPNLHPDSKDYVFIYLSLRDIVLLMQQLDDRMPVFLYQDNSLWNINERQKWQEILLNGQ